MIDLCTIFNSKYIDKGIQLYKSLERVCLEEFTLYVYALDELAVTILREYNFKSMIVVSIADVENNQMLEVKKERALGEYCWTCTPFIIKYTLTNYGVQMCTYIDADMEFFCSPSCILDELSDERWTVGVMGHRFANKALAKKREESAGKFCVEFNTFKNEKRSLALLEKWGQQCLEKCDMENCGDQLYLTHWCDDYDFVHEYKHLGGGVSPWNIGDYKFEWESDNVYTYCGGIKWRLVFYHYQGMEYSDDRRVKLYAFTSMIGMGSKVKTKDLYNIYVPYLYSTEKIRKEIGEKYGIDEFVYGCNRKFELYPFNLLKFLKGISRRIKEESFASAINFVICVLRKKRDIIRLSELNDKKYRKYMNRWC